MEGNKKSSVVSRRNFLAKTGLSLAGISAAPGYLGMLDNSTNGFIGKMRFQNQNPDGILKKGQIFNESEEFADLFTGRATRRLTRFRPVNQQPTYHLNTCFSADSRYLILTTTMDDGSSALIRAEVATGEMAVLETVPKGQYLYGNVIQALNSVVSIAHGKLKLFNLATLKETIVLEDASGLNGPIGSYDGSRIFVMKKDQPVIINGATVRPVIHCDVNLATAEVRELFRETRAQSNHVVPSPTDPDLILIDRDWPRPPENPLAEINTNSRVWILNVKTKQLFEVRPNDICRFQIHSNWSYKGDYVYYHGTSKWSYYPKSPAGHYIGVADKKGKVIWEGHFPTYFYGHVSSHTRANVIITDALLTKNLITAIHWEERNSQNIPRIEILAQHDTNWVAGQDNHPHPHVSPDGKWLSYNRGTAVGTDGGSEKEKPAIIKNIYEEPVGYQPNRSDVYVVRL